MNFEINRISIWTMMDGKVCAALNNATSSSTWYLCQPMTKPSLMNNLNLIKNKTTTRSALLYGISSLHLLMNTMESILNLSYKLSTKKMVCTNSKEEGYR